MYWNKTLRSIFSLNSNSSREEEENYCNQVNEYTASQVMILYLFVVYDSYLYHENSIELDNVGHQSETSPDGSEASNRAQIRRARNDQKTSHQRICLVATLLIFGLGCCLALATIVFPTDDSKG